MSLSAAVAAAILKRTINATRLIYFFYQLLGLALSPAIAFYLLYRGLRDRRYFTHLAERFGFLPDSVKPTGAGAIWFHAVSVGEVLSAVELLRRLRIERPQVHLYVSTTTLAGRAMAEQKLAGIAHGVFFAPLDYRSIVRRVLRRLRPSLVVIFETEIWPNLYRESKRACASLLVVNGRISDKALPSYTRRRWFFQHVLCYPDAILAQTSEDARRYVIAGASQARVQVGGNLKYDFVPPVAGITPDIAEYLDSLGPAKIWIAASTMPPATAGDIDEDDAVIEAFRFVSGRQKNLLLILVPRKPERFPVVAEKLRDADIPFVRRSEMNRFRLTLPGVLLLDTMGELASLFERADVVFMGGTLAARGGHNILEPAFFAKPIIAGPHLENFAAIAEEFNRAEAILRIKNVQELGPAVASFLSSEYMANTLGNRARNLANSKRGVTGKIAQEIWRYYDEGIPNPYPLLIARLFLTPLSWLWRAASRWNLERSLCARQSLHAPVISVGGLTMGGSGKTPLVTHLAERLHEMGHNPAILTRGYKRKSAVPVVLVDRGKKATLDLTGDEAQLFIRSGHAHVGIARNRFAAGLQVEERVSPDVFLLDDGFQHQKLARKHDLVLIDALDPFGGGVFPLGRSREPREALRRATAIILSRADLDHPNTGLERQLREINPHAPIFRSSVVPKEWVSVKTATVVPQLGPAKVVAFCGLGNPRAFWATLDELKLDVAFRWAFGDHHSYRPAELHRLAQQASTSGAIALVTTEKDCVNLPADAAAIVAPFEIYWLKIGIQIDREDELLRLLS